MQGWVGNFHRTQVSLWPAQQGMEIQIILPHNWEATDLFYIYRNREVLSICSDEDRSRTSHPYLMEFLWDCYTCPFQAFYLYQSWPKGKIILIFQLSWIHSTIVLTNLYTSRHNPMNDHMKKCKVTVRVARFDAISFENDMHPYHAIGLSDSSHLIDIEILI